MTKISTISYTKIIKLKKLKIFKTQAQEIIFVDKLYEKILKEIYPKINKAANINLAKRSWRILIGPWLIRFIVVVVDRIKYIKNKKNFKKQKKFKNLITNNISEFTNNIQNDEWNKYFLYRLHALSKKVKKINYIENKVDNYSKLNYLKKIIFNFLIKLIIFPFSSINNFVFYKPYLGKSFKTLLFFWKIKEIPIIYSLKKDENYIFKYNRELREKIILNNKRVLCEYEKIIKHLIIECIPTFYIEGVEKLDKELETSIYPSKKKIIFTGSLTQDNLFKFWVARSVAKGSKLIIRQHGANYGQLKFNETEKHEIEISDKFFTNGWQGENTKIFASNNFQAFYNKKINQNYSKKILIVSGDLRFYKTNNRDFNNDFNSEINFVKNFLKKFEEKDLKNFDYKSHPFDIKNNFYKERLLKKIFPKINFLKINVKLDNIYKNYCKVIFLYNATDFLKLLGQNLPSIMLIDKSFINTLNKKTQKLFNQLKDAKLFFSEPQIAFNHIKQSNEETMKWWIDNKTKKAKNKFASEFSNVSKKNFESSINVLRKIRL